MHFRRMILRCLLRENGLHIGRRSSGEAPWVVLTLLRRTYSSDSPNTFSVISFYKFRTLDKPKELTERVRSTLEGLEVKGRIYLNRAGVNAQMCLPSRNSVLATNFFSEHISPDIDFKTHYSDFQVFNRLRQGKEP